MLKANPCIATFISTTGCLSLFGQICAACYCRYGYYFVFFFVCAFSFYQKYHHLIFFFFSSEANLEHQLKLSSPSFPHILKYKIHRLLKVFLGPVDSTSRILEEVNCCYLRYWKIEEPTVKKKQNKLYNMQIQNLQTNHACFYVFLKPEKTLMFFGGGFLQLPQWIKLIPNLSEQFLTAGVYCASNHQEDSCCCRCCQPVFEMGPPSPPIAALHPHWLGLGLGRGVVQVLLFSDPNPLTSPPPLPPPTSIYTSILARTLIDRTYSPDTAITPNLNVLTLSANKDKERERECVCGFCLCVRFYAFVFSVEQIIL